MSRNINARLWNPDLGVYSLSLDSPDNYSVNCIAFCIKSSVANETQAASLVSALSKLKVGPGYKDSTIVNSSEPDTNISPNTNGFLLEAIMSQDAEDITRDLLESLWTPMIRNHETSTGASREYVSMSGDLGLGLFTSLAHLGEELLLIYFLSM